MRKLHKFTMIGLLLLFLACNFPTRTAKQTPVCTPPACSEDEVYFCPDTCPGGCGTGCATPTGQSANITPAPICTARACAENEVYYCPGECNGGCGISCATPTGQPATQSPTPEQDPTGTPFPLCTPPACKSDEEYFCESECLGGCGTICVTPTPTITPEAELTKEAPLPTSTQKPEVVTPPVIQSFTADRSTITQGESLNVSWVASGGTTAEMQWLGNNGTMEGVNNIAPDGSTIAISPPNNPVILNVSNSAGTTTKNLELTIQCAHPWVSDLATAHAGSCPKAAEIGWAAEQPFEHGFMIWLEPSQTIIVFFTDYGGQSYRIYEDKFKEGDPTNDPNIVPPQGLLQPQRGFGLVWRENTEVRVHLGWATAGETGFETWRQSYQGMGMHNIKTWLKDINQNIIELDPNASAWKIIQP